MNDMLAFELSLADDLSEKADELKTLFCDFLEKKGVFLEKNEKTRVLSALTAIEDIVYPFTTEAFREDDPDEYARMMAREEYCDANDDEQ